MEDGKIVELFLQRNESAIQETSNRYGRRLRSLAYGIVEDLLTAQECENDTYLEAWNSIPPHEPREYFYPFLARITRHISLNICRDRSRLKRSAHICALTEEMEQCIPAPDNLQCRLERDELARAINGFLATQEPKKRNVFLRRYWYLDSISAISLRYGYSESKIKSMLLRSRNQLRAYLQKEGYLL